MERRVRPASSACRACHISAGSTRGGTYHGVDTAYLGTAMLGELDSVVRNELVDIAVPVPLGLRMANQDYHLDGHQLCLAATTRRRLTRGFPILVDT